MRQRADKIRITIVVRHPIGGIRTFLRYVYTKFEQQKYKFFLILPETSELEALRHDLQAMDCSFIVLRKDAGWIEFSKALSNILKKNAIDLLHSHGFTSMIYSLVPGILYRTPHLFTSHDVFTLKQFVGVRGVLKKSALGFCFRMVDIIHSVSNDAQQNLLEYFPLLKKYPDKLVVIPNGIEVDRFYVDEQEDWQTQLGLEEEDFLIGFFGRFMGQKGFKYLIEAMEILILSDLMRKPMVLCFGWGGYIREEQAVIQQKGLQNFFHFLPFQENPAKAMRGLDVVTIPSLWEACPLLPMEALVAGVPVIGTACVGLREVLQCTPARVVPAANSQMLAEAIIAEMANPRQKQMADFREVAAMRFNVIEKVEKLIKIIDELIA